MKYSIIIILLFTIVNSCKSKKDITEERSLELKEVFIQKVVPGTEEEAPHYKIGFVLPDKNTITTIDSALYGGKILKVHPDSNNFQMKVNNSKKELPFKVYYTYSGKNYVHTILNIIDKEADYRP